MYQTVEPRFLDMPLSWNEIRLRASDFVSGWKENTQKAREEADAHDFQTDFLNIFGVTRRQVATFEHRIDFFKTTEDTEFHREETKFRPSVLLCELCGYKFLI